MSTNARYYLSYDTKTTFEIAFFGMKMLKILQYIHDIVMAVIT